MSVVPPSTGHHAVLTESAAARTPIVPWLALAAAVVWVVFVRVPLVLNAADHLDSDLAVDGLTLLEATHGHYRWHYPGTPFMGTGSVLLSLPAALIWGPTPAALVSGGLIAYVGLIVATFLLVRLAAGSRAAAWSLVPLTFASTGIVWLAGRITGGHLIAATWHAGGFALFAWCLSRPSRWRALVIGAWCGIGLYLDSMVAVTVIGLLAATGCSWAMARFPVQGLVLLTTAALGFAGTVWLKPLASRLEPYDAYREQFSPVTETELLASHSQLLFLDCLPRLFAGHRIPSMASDPDPGALNGRSPVRALPKADILDAAVLGIASLVTLASLAGLIIGLVRGPSTLRSISFGLSVAALATLVGFVVNRNIFNSDNYRYCVSLLVPWSLGVGVALERLACSGKAGKALAFGLVALLFVGMTSDVARWYSRFGWLDASGMPVRKVVDDPTLAWLEAHPQVTWVEGSYWDVYRLSFLTSGRVKGKPFAVYPDRFPEWRAPELPAKATLARATPEAKHFVDAALREGRRAVSYGRGVSILNAPAPSPSK